MVEFYTYRVNYYEIPLFLYICIFVYENLYIYIYIYVNIYIFSNPNEQMENDHGSRQERSRYKTIEWTAYESVHKKYLNFGKFNLKCYSELHTLSIYDTILLNIIYHVT